MAEPRKKRLKTGEVSKELLISAILDKNLKKLRIIVDNIEKNKQDLISIVDCGHHSNFNRCVLLLAMKTKNADLVDLLLSKGLCTGDKKIQDCLVHEAIKINDLSVMQKLSDHGFLLLSTCDHKESPLFELVALGRLKWLQLFHKAGVPFEGKTKGKEPLLYFALKKKGTTEKLIRLLLYWGANLDERNSEDLTPLHYLATSRRASKIKKTEFAKILIKYGCNINTWSNKRLENVLYTAAHCGNADLVELLIMHGANLNRWWYNCSPLKDIFKKDFKFHLRVLLKELVKLDPGYLFDHRELRCSDRCSRVIWKELYINIDNTVRMHDIIMANEDKLMKLAKNPKITRFVYHSQLVQSQSLWKEFLEFQIKKGQERAILIQRCEQPFREIFKWETVPVLVVDKIFSYLSRNDLRSFYASFYPATFLESLISSERFY